MKDKYGFVEGTNRSRAAAMFGSARGATMKDIREATGDNAHTVIQLVKSRGFIVETADSLDGKIYKIRDKRK